MRLSRLMSVLFVIAMALVGALLMVDNSVPVALRVLDWTSVELPLFWWMAGALLVGVLIGIAGTWPTVVRLQLAVRAQRRAAAAPGPGLAAQPTRDPVQ